MLIVGLTGGIASGKTTATDFFSRQGVPVLDADVIVHDLLSADETTYNEITALFGSDIVQTDNTIDRKKIRSIIFSDKQKRLKLEAIIHPKVREQIKKEITLLQSGPNPAYCIVCIPLLIETRQQDLLQRILLIDVPQETQIQRLRKRDKLSTDEIKNILLAQASREERLEAADDVIENNTNIEQFEKQLLNIHNIYTALAEK